MNTMIDNSVKEKEWLLSPKDRCDSCAAEALVQITGLNGDLLFCGHHYNKIMDTPDSHEKMIKFAITITDERDKLIKKPETETW
jgi:hypothetical protein